MAKWKRSGADALREYEQSSNYVGSIGVTPLNERSTSEAGGTWKRSGADALREYEQSSSFPQTLQVRKYNAEDRNYDQFAAERYSAQVNAQRRDTNRHYQEQVNAAAQAFDNYRRYSSSGAAKNAAHQNYEDAKYRQELARQQMSGKHLTPAEQKILNTTVYRDPAQAAAQEAAKNTPAAKNRQWSEEREQKRREQLSEQEFNRSGAMQEQYGSYDNYLRGVYAGYDEAVARREAEQAKSSDTLRAESADVQRQIAEIDARQRAAWTQNGHSGWDADLQQEKKALQEQRRSLDDRAYWKGQEEYKAGRQAERQAEQDKYAGWTAEQMQARIDEIDAQQKDAWTRSGASGYDAALQQEKKELERQKNRVAPGWLQKAGNFVDDALTAFYEGGNAQAMSGLEMAHNVAETKLNQGAAWALRDIANSATLHALGGDRYAEKLRSLADRMATEYDYTDAQALQDDYNRIMGEVLQDHSPAGTWVLQQLPSAGAMAVDLMVSTATGGAINPMAAMGIRAGGNAMLDAHNAGATDTQALLIGLQNAAVEVLSEKLFGGNPVYDEDVGLVNKAVSKLTKSKTVMKVLDSKAFDFASEGLEEVVAELLEPTFQSLVLKGTLKGATNAENIGNAFLGGVFLAALGNLAGLPGGLTQAKQERQTKYYAKILAEQGAQSENADVREAAAIVQEKLDYGRTPDMEDLGRVLSAMDDAGETQAAQAAAEAAQESTVVNTNPSVAEQSSTVKQTDASTLSSMAQTLGKSGQKAIFKAYDSKTDTAEYAGEFVKVYNAARAGNDLPETKTLEPWQRYAAETAGKNDMEPQAAQEIAAVKPEQTSGQTTEETPFKPGLDYSDYVKAAVRDGEMTTETAQQIDTVAKRLGVRVRFADEVAGGTANAELSGNEVLIEKHNNNPVMFLLGHELTHRIQETAPEQYQQFREAIMDEIRPQAQSVMENYAQRGYEITEEAALDEAAADYAGRMIDDGEVLDDFIEKHRDDRTLLQKIIDAIRSFIRKLTGAERKKAETAEGKLLAAMDAAAENTKTAASDGGTRYSAKSGNEGREATQAEITTRYQQSVHDILNGASSSSDALLVGYTPEVYQKLGMPDLPFVVGSGHVYSMAKTADEASAEGKFHKGVNYHGLGENVVADILDFVKDPVMVISAKDVDAKTTPMRSTHSVVALIDVGTGKESMVIPVAITAERTVNGMRMDVNAISSAYEKNTTGLVNEAIAQFNAGENSVFYVKKGAANLLGAGVQFPEQLKAAASSDGIVRKFDSKINMSVQNVTESKQFKNWFGDWQNHPESASKVVNADGTPKVVYHQTENEFTVFDIRRNGAGTSDNETPFGIFLKSSEKDIGLRGKNQMALYANIRNPLSVQNRAELKQRLRALSPEYDAIVREHTALDAEYKQRFEEAKNNFVRFLTDWKAAHPGENSRSLYGTPEFERVFNAEDTIVEEWGEKANELSYRAKEVITDALRKAGYDGIILANDAGSWGRSTDAYIALDPEQVKSATDNVGTFDRNNPDIRYSVKGAEVSREYADVLKENELLKGRVDYWKGQTKRTDRATTNEKSVSREATSLVKRYGAELDASDIQGDLQSLYDAMANGELDGKEAFSQAKEIAGKLVENAVEADDELYQSYKDLRNFLRTTKLTISEEDGKNVPDLAELRKRNFGRMTIGKGQTNIDQVYQELADQWPEFFDEDAVSHPADQLQQIADVLGNIYTITEQNPYQGYMEQAKTAAANEILDDFFELPQTRKTFADRQAAALSEAKAKGKAQAQKVREQKNAQLADLREKNRARVNSILEKERTRRADQINKLKEQYKSRDTAAKDRREARELRNKIIRHTKGLSQKLLRPTDKQHIPEILKHEVAAMLESINMEDNYTLDPATIREGKVGKDGKTTLYGEKLRGSDRNEKGVMTRRSEAFAALKAKYTQIVKDGDAMTVDPYLLGDNSEGIRGGFDEVIAMKDTPLADLSKSQLQTVWNVVRAVEHSVSTYGKMLSNAKYAQTRTWAEAIRNDVSERRPIRKRTTRLTLDLETPYTFFSHYGDAGKAIYRMLRDAQDQQQLIVDRITEETQKIVDPKMVNQLEKQTHTFQAASGKTLTLTTAQAMEIYNLMQRKQALEHLTTGGIIQPEIKSAKIGRGFEAIRLTEAGLQQIAGSLTAEQVKIADGLQGLTTGLLADYGNDASMRAYGYKKFTEKGYWPIRSAREGVQSTVEKGGNQLRSIQNVGLAKPLTPGANNPLDVPGIFTTFSNHAAEMTDYAAWLCTMEDANHLFNYQFRDENGLPTGRNIRQILDEYGGRGAQSYWRSLMDNIQNGINLKEFGPMTDFAGKAISGFKGAAVGGNIRVVIQQPTAFFRAAAVLDPADMAKGLVKGVKGQGGWSRALEYSPIAMRKDNGGFDISAPYTMKETLFDTRTAVRKLNDTLSAPAGAADAVTWGRLWNACEWTVHRENPYLEPGSKAFYEQTAKQFAEVIDQTQVVDGVLQRSNIMRNKGEIAKQATSFMGEPIMSLNLLIRSWDNVRYEQEPRKRGRAIKTFGRAVMALVVTAAVNAMAQSLIDAIRDDDPDKDYKERYLSAFTGISGDEETTWQKAWNAVMEGNLGGNLNYAGNIPYVKDVLSLLQGYEVNRMDTEVIGNLVDAGKMFAQNVDGKGTKTSAYAVKSLLGAASKVYGIPVNNLTRDLWGMVRSVAVETKNIPVQYEMEKAIYNITNNKNKSRYISILYRALEQGDVDSFQHIRSDLMNTMGLDGVEIDESLRSRYNKAVKKDPAYTLPQAARDLIGSRDKYKEETTDEKFSAKNLNETQYLAYSDQRATDYREIEDALKDSDTYQSLDAKTRSKLIEAAYDLVEQQSLEDHSDGQYEITTKWMTLADDAEKIGIEPYMYVTFHVVCNTTESTKGADGKAVKGQSKSDKIRKWLKDNRNLTEQQRKFLWESVYESDW